MPKNEELRKILMEIKYRHGLTQSEISDKIGVNFKYLSNVLNGHYPFSEELKEKLYRQFTDVEITRMDHPKSSEKLEDADVPLYDIDAAANLRTLMGDKTANILGRISIPNIPSCDGAVYVRGDSMYPILKTGDIVAYKMVNDIQALVDGEMYLVNLEMDGDEYLTVKYVHRSNKGEGWVQLASYNQHHGPMDVRLENIKAIALVKFSVRINTMV